MKVRTEEIIKRCGGSILDIGCVQHSLESIKHDFWLHGQLTENFSNVMGIDILKEDIHELKKLGYNVKYGDAENFELDEKFDTIAAGELIEHLSNPGKFLDCCRKHLKDEGKLILTTPNPYWIEYTVRRFFKRLYVNPEHTALYDETVLTHFAERHNFKVVEVKYIVERYNPSSIAGFFWHKIIYPLLLKLLPKELSHDDILFVLKKKQNEGKNEKKY